MPRDGTGRIRTIDPGFWTHPKTLAVMEEDPLALLLLVGLRSCPVDDAGRFRADARSLKAQVLPVHPQATTEWVAQALELLARHRLLHLYQVERTKYGVIHDWHDWQRVNRPTPSVFPPPPAGLCRCCGQEAAALPRAPDGGSSSGRAPSPAPPRLLTAEEEGRGAEAGGSAFPPPAPAPEARACASPTPAACCWCVHPTADAAPTVQRLAQVYHDAYREAHGECPLPLDKAKDWPALKRLAGSGRSFERLRDVLRHGVNSQDSLLVRNGHRVAVLVQHYQGIAQALDQGECHGAPTRTHTAGTAARFARWHPPAPASSFGPGGETEF